MSYSITPSTGLEVVGTILEGAAEGDEVGATVEGAVDGDEVGPWLGATVDGAEVGPNVGLAVGALIVTLLSNNTMFFKFPLK